MDGADAVFPAQDRTLVRHSQCLQAPEQGRDLRDLREHGGGQGVGRLGAFGHGKILGCLSVHDNRSGDEFRVGTVLIAGVEGGMSLELPGGESAEEVEGLLRLHESQADISVIEEGDEIAGSERVDFGGLVVLWGPRNFFSVKVADDFC